MMKINTMRSFVFSFIVAALVSLLAGCATPNNQAVQTAAPPVAATPAKATSKPAPAVAAKPAPATLPAPTTQAATPERPARVWANQRTTVWTQPNNLPMGESVDAADDLYEIAMTAYHGSIGAKNPAVHRKVIALFEKIVKEYPKSNKAGAAAITIGHIYAQPGTVADNVKALEWFERATKLPDPNTAAEGNWLMGAYSDSAHDNAKAIRFYQAATDSKLLIDSVQQSIDTRLAALKEAAATQPTTATKPAE